MLEQHIQIAVMLHDIKDVYITEHEDCGAYENFLKHEVYTGSSEMKLHRDFAMSLGKEINRKEYTNSKGEKYWLGVHAFYIDLRGNVTHLCTIT